MFGYIRPSKPRLSEQDEARFQSVYCGLCHELGRKYGFSARFVLNFDFTFLAILLSGAQEPECESCRCAAHPCKAQCVMAHTDALETAADHSLVLAWWQIKDHIEDHGFFKAIPYRLASLLLRRAYHQASKCVPEFDASVQRHLNDLHECERACCASIDRAAEPFAALMADIADCVAEPSRQRVMKEIFYHLGRWIYLVDAADDFEKDAHSHCYNPLRSATKSTATSWTRKAGKPSHSHSTFPYTAWRALTRCLTAACGRAFLTAFSTKAYTGSAAPFSRASIISPRAGYTSAQNQRKTRKPYERPLSDPEYPAHGN